MNCKRCGRVLDGEGDICIECYNEFQCDDDNKEILRVNQKYSPKYILTKKMIEVYIIFIFLIVVSFYSKNVLGVFLFGFLLAVIVLGALIISKRNAKGTYMSFYNKKIVFKGRFLFIKTNKEIRYDEIKDVVFTQGTSFCEKFFQKLFKLGNIYVYPKKGNIISNGMQLKIVDNIDRVIQDVSIVVGERLK